MAEDITKRKLLVIGDYSYMITLPKTWVKKLRWRAKQMVQLELRDGEIVVSTMPKKK